jgi:hypothetical protein
MLLHPCLKFFVRLAKAGIFSKILVICYRENSAMERYSTQSPQNLLLSLREVSSRTRSMGSCAVWWTSRTVPVSSSSSKRSAHADIRISWSITASSSTNAYSSSTASASALARLDIYDRHLLAIVRALSELPDLSMLTQTEKMLINRAHVFIEVRRIRC